MYACIYIYSTHTCIMINRKKNILTTLFYILIKIHLFGLGDMGKKSVKSVKNHISVFVGRFISLYLLADSYLCICWPIHISVFVGRFISLYLLVDSYLCICWPIHISVFVGRFISLYLLVDSYLCICWPIHISVFSSLGLKQICI